jgi:hypothetical protein
LEGSKVEGIVQLKDVTLAYNGPSGGTLLVYTDMPGGVLALRRTIVLPATTGEREQKTFPLDSPSLLEGKLIKWRASSAGTLILYEGSVRARKVGLYIDGAAGETWETQPLSLG